MTTEELKRLLDRVSHGDKEAFCAVYTELKVPVFTLIMRIVRNRCTAEDIMQEVFLNIFRDPPDDGVRDPRAWIFRMARNRSIDALRRKTECPLDDASGEAFASDGDIAARLDIERAIAAIPLEEREIIALHLTAGFSFRQTADIMDISMSAAYRLYEKALRTLQSELKGEKQ